MFRDESNVGVSELMSVMSVVVSEAWMMTTARPALGVCRVSCIRRRVARPARCVCFVGYCPVVSVFRPAPDAAGNDTDTSAVGLPESPPRTTRYRRPDSQPAAAVPAAPRLCGARTTSFITLNEWPDARGEQAPRNFHRGACAGVGVR